MNNVYELVTASVELGATIAFERMGVTAGEMSQRQAKKVYGKYFVDLLNTGRIRPVRQEAGHAGTKYFRVADILGCKVEDRAKAQLLNTL